MRTYSRLSRKTSTSNAGCDKLPQAPRERIADSFSIRRTARHMRLPFCTTMAGAQAAVEGIRALKTQRFEVKALQDYHPSRA